MTVLNAVQSSARDATTAVADATSGVGGVLTAPFASNRSTPAAVKSEAKNALNGVFDLGVIPLSAVVIYLLWFSGGSGDPLPFALGKATFVGLVAFMVTGVARRWL